VDQAVINIQIAAMMSVNHRRIDCLEGGSDGLNQFKQWALVKALIRQTAEPGHLASKYLCRCTGRTAQSVNLFRPIVKFALAVARSCAFRDY
jgi:hypothetical protein